MFVAMGAACATEGGAPSPTGQSDGGPVDFPPAKVQDEPTGYSAAGAGGEEAAAPPYEAEPAPEASPPMAGGGAGAPPPMGTIWMPPAGAAGEDPVSSAATDEGFAPPPPTGTTLSAPPPTGTIPLGAAPAPVAEAPPPPLGSILPKLDASEFEWLLRTTVLPEGPAEAKETPLLKAYVRPGDVPARAEVFLGGKWQDMLPEEWKVIQEHLGKGERRFTYKARGQQYTVDMDDEEGPVQVNEGTGKKRMLRFTDAEAEHDDDVEDVFSLSYALPTTARASSEAFPRVDKPVRRPFAKPAAADDAGPPLHELEIGEMEEEAPVPTGTIYAAFEAATSDVPVATVYPGTVADIAAPAPLPMATIYPSATSGPLPMGTIYPSMSTAAPPVGTIYGAGGYPPLATAHAKHGPTLASISEEPSTEPKAAPAAPPPKPEIPAAPKAAATPAKAAAKPIAAKPPGAKAGGEATRAGSKEGAEAKAKAKPKPKPKAAAAAAASAPPAAGGAAAAAKAGGAPAGAAAKAPAAKHGAASAKASGAAAAASSPAAAAAAKPKAPAAGATPATAVKAKATGKAKPKMPAKAKGAAPATAAKAAPAAAKAASAEPPPVPVASRKEIMHLPGVPDEILQQWKWGPQSKRGGAPQYQLNVLHLFPHARGCFNQMFEREESLCPEYAVFYHLYNYSALIYEVQAAVASILFRYRAQFAPLPRLLAKEFKNIPDAATLIQKFETKYAKGMKDHDPEFRAVGLSTMLSLVALGPECSPPVFFCTGYDKGSYDMKFRPVLDNLLKACCVPWRRVTSLGNEILKLCEKHGLDVSPFGGAKCPSGMSGHMLQIFVRRDILDEYVYAAHPWGPVWKEHMPISKWLGDDEDFGFGQARIVAHPKMFMSSKHVRMFVASADPMFHQKRRQFQAELRELLNEILGKPELRQKAASTIYGGSLPSWWTAEDQSRKATLASAWDHTETNARHELPSASQRYVEPKPKPEPLKPLAKLRAKT
eukprot:TRINITY_DN66096_c0_g1_i1.p1 TRINITY_DN66096_c0_g1~~TRINITY_DN66096_c0_g1_i1.p1  ORF type:complete len:994 (-),score=259.37 TRINITY_DN66096_c0_g1_i1:110-3091(-)